MAIKYLKKAIKTPSTDDHKTRTVVQNILNTAFEKVPASSSTAPPPVSPTPPPLLNPPPTHFLCAGKRAKTTS